MIPVTVPFFRLPQTELAFAVQETVPFAEHETDEEIAVFVVIFELIWPDLIGPEPFVTPVAS